MAMNASIFFLGFIPVVTLVHVLSCVPLFELYHWSPFKPDVSDYYAAGLSGLLLPLLIRALKRLGEDGGNYKRIFVPLAEQVVRMLCVVYISSDGILKWEPLLIFFFNYGLIEIIIKLYQTCPLGYQRRYRRFLNYYNMFKRYEALDEISHSCRSDYKRIFENAICDFDDSKRDSVGSFNSEETLVSKVSFRELPSTFNLKDDCATNEDTSPSSPLLIASNHDHLCHNLVERLYSVSPKNTYHLDHKAACVIVNDADNSTDRSSNDSVEGINCNSLCDELEHSSNSQYEILISLKTRFGGGGGGGFKYKMPNGSTLKLGGGGGFDYQHSDCSGDEVSDSEEEFAERGYRWLLPNLILHGEFRRKAYKKPTESSHLLTQKLSSYTLSSSKQTDIISLGGDLESQGRPLTTSDRFSKFKDFICSHLDQDQNIQLNIDPFFKRFSFLTIEVSSIYAFIALFNNMIWNWMSFVMIVAFFTTHKSCFIMIFVALTFLQITELYYLNRCIRAFKVNLILQLILNIIFASTTYLSVLFLS
ncbi:uncharacterized protein PRCAT00000682001 [Priceomyces carsonii]|uniref:uncharacterized protein n=1 Tax=Priceomyces carsonii TaxID=28549 RepID=UPI002ED8D081|nr:unnamed protein product [Priceomyces carsonii]